MAFQRVIMIVRRVPGHLLRALPACQRTKGHNRATPAPVTRVNMTTTRQYV